MILVRMRKIVSPLPVLYVVFIFNITQPSLINFVHETFEVSGSEISSAYNPFPPFKVQPLPSFLLRFGFN